LSGYIFATKARIDNRRKNLLSSNMSSRYSHNMANFGSLAAEIGPVAWGTPANFNGFRVLVALLHGSQVVGWASAKLCGVEQRAPPMFGRATITLGIGPHSIWNIKFAVTLEAEKHQFFQILSDSCMSYVEMDEWI